MKYILSFLLIFICINESYSETSGITSTIDSVTLLYIREPLEKPVNISILASDITNKTINKKDDPKIKKIIYNFFIVSCAIMISEEMHKNN